MITKPTTMRRKLVALTTAGAFAALAGCSSSVGAVTVAQSPKQSPATVSDPSAAPTPSISAALLTGPPRTVTMTGSDDILIHPSLWQQAQADGVPGNPNFAPMLAGVKQRVSAADYSICHDETQFNDPSGPITSFPHDYLLDTVRTPFNRRNWSTTLESSGTATSCRRSSTISCECTRAYCHG